MSIYLRNFIRFIFLILIQVLILNKIPLNWWAPPFTAFIYPLFILLLPLTTPLTYSMVLGFILGLTMDAFMNTGGIHAFTCVLIATARRPLLALLLPQPLEFYKSLAPGPKSMGWGPFLTYASIIMLLHNVVYTFIEVWSLKSFFYILFKTGVTFFMSMAFVILYLLIFTKGVNRRINTLYD